MQTSFLDLPRPAQPRRIRELPPHETPEARLGDLGASALSEAEILTLILNLATLDQGWQLLETFDGLAGLQRASLAELSRGPGMTKRKATVLKAALELVRRLALQPGVERIQIKRPADAAPLFQALIGHQDQEHLVVACLDTKNRLKKLHTVYIGSVNSASIRVGEIFKEPIRLNSTALIVCHNHPSADVTPSPDDVLVTRAIREAGQLLDCELLDHLIVSATTYVSLRERRLGFD